MTTTGTGRMSRVSPGRSPTTESASRACVVAALSSDAKVCDDQRGCPYDFVANGILWSVGCDWRRADGSCFGLQHARIVNVSLSGTAVSQTLQDAVNKAWTKCAVLTCSAGNDGATTLAYPAAYAN